MLWGKNDSKTATGTVAIAANGLVTGTSTEFEVEAKVGDVIRSNDTDFLIVAITSNTSAQVISNAAGVSITPVDAGNAYTLSEKTKFVRTSEVPGFRTGDLNDVFGVDVNEASAGRVTGSVVINPGSGYTANATVTVTGGNGSGATANAQANSDGKISNVNISAQGTGYTSVPTITIAPPATVAFNALTAVSNTADTITISSAPRYQVGDKTIYSVAAGNTAIGGLTAGETYYISFANSTAVALAETPGGANVDLTAGTSETGHGLTGETATGVLTVTGAAAQGLAHAGWVRRTVGTGGRAGRVQLETLVAGSSITGDQADDTEFPDS